jgi:Flp pilus assembly protein CpaB
MKQKNVILMVVAVGCGLVAAFLTSQMNARSNVEQVDVIVAAKDLPVGTMLTREDLATEKVVKVKRVPKDGLPPAFITNREDLVDKKLSRPVRAEETFNPQDLNTKGAVTLPPGMNMVSLQLGAGQAAAGFVGPGSRVNVLATVRVGNRLNAFPLLVNMLVVAVDQQTTYTKEGMFPSLSMVSFAVTEKQALLLSLAKNRGCSLELMLRGENQQSEADKDYDLDRVIKIMSDDRDSKNTIYGSTDASREPGSKDPNEKDPKEKPADKATEVKPTEKPVSPFPDVPQPAPTPREGILVVKVLVAKSDVAAGTQVTADLIKEKFELKELPAAYASEGLADLSEAYGKEFRSLVAKGQWVTGGMVGIQGTKVSPRLTTIEPKPGEKETPASDVPTKRRHLDVAVHTSSGTIIHRYEEYAPDKWKKIAELTPAQANREESGPPAPPAPPAPKTGEPDSKKAID